MKKFPVKIDLSTFFEDERKFVIILVDPQWKSVENLQHRVEEIFDVHPVHFLTKDNLFIPPQESVEVVEFTESLKAFIPKRAVEESRRRSKEFSKTENKTEVLKCGREELAIDKKSVKKRKYHTLGAEILGSSTPNQSKKSKRTTAVVSDSPVLVPNESQEITSTNEQCSLYKEDTKVPAKISHDNRDPSYDKVSESNISENQSLTTNEEETPSKRKKKRSRKQVSVKQTHSELKTGERTVISVTLRPDIPSSTFLNNSKSKHEKSHIYFDDDLTVVESSTNKQPSNVNNKHVSEKSKASTIIFKCNLNNVDTGKPLVFPLRVINKCHKAGKPIIDIRENILLPPANLDILTKTAVSNELKTSIITEIENDSQMVNVEEETDLCNKNEITADKEEIPSENAIAQKETQNANLSMAELSCDGNNSQSDATNINPKKSQESSAITQSNTSKASDTSNNSLALDESCVIDLDDDDEDVIDLSDADEQQEQSLRTSRNTNLLETLNKSISSMSVDEMLPFCIPLTSIPTVGDTVVFKFNRQSLGEERDISEFIACKCEHVNRRTKVLKLSIIDASLEKDNIPQQYIYNLDESLDTRFLSIKFPEMIDAKVLEA